MGFDSIAIFILATTLRNSVRNRIVPTVSTWGKEFGHLYFVMGTNVKDKQFLDMNCDLNTSGRKLGAPQTRPEDKLLEYTCKGDNSNRINILFTANCTGNYFGLGPTCRCEESIRFYSNSPRFKQTKWFMFIDDDLYIRPRPLISLLDGFDGSLSNSIALIRYSGVRTIVYF